ncbi:hypothetical protein NDA16_004391 [Ustilago loliicola]|nr:hypothetical protein NDA16_004391 [Ustilago loliicola]
MQGTHSTAPAPTGASNSLSVEPHSDLERKPTWAQISFDDGFDLNLGSTSALAVTHQKAGDSAASSSVQNTRPLAERSSTATASTNPPTTTTTVPNHTDAAPVAQESKRFSASPTSSNKTLPSLPPISNSVMDKTPSTPSSRRLPSSDASAAAMLPASTSYASTLHARAASSQDGAPTPKPPGTPQPYPSASPIVTAATPEQPQYTDPSATPTARSTMHQPSRSQSGSILAFKPPRPVSSADAYMQPVETLHSETPSRPGTAMSHLSGSNWMHDGPSNRSSVGTTSTMPFNQTKRASVLSFQTANSAGFTSGDEARASDREDLADDVDGARTPGAVNTGPSHPNSIRPWLDQGYSGYGSSPDERSFPGGLPGSFWDEPLSQAPARDVPGPTTAATAAASVIEEAKPIPAPLAPASVPTQALSAASTSSRPAVPTGSTDAVTNATITNRDARESQPSAPSSNIEPTLAPIKTQGLAPTSSNAPLSSTTIAAPSDETAQDMSRSPEVTQTRQPSLTLPEDNAPPPPAKDVRIVELAAPISASNSPRNGGNAVLTEGVPSPAPADNVIPPPLPSEAIKSQPPLATDMLMNGPADQKPVSDYRKKPLADISPAQKAAGLAHLQSQAKVAKQANMEMQAQSQAPPTAPPAEAPPVPVLERGRRKSTASLTANVALAQAGATGMSRNDMVDRPDTSSAESASQESSAPPDGEVEARAEWERRRRMKRKNVKKQNEAAKPQKGRSDTFKNQLKPLQLVPTDNLSSFSDRNGLPNSASNVATRGNGDRHSIAMGNRAANALVSSTPDAPGSGQTYSTSQLQRLQAREQRRSVGAFSAAMAAANVVSSGSNGPYPVFASPNSGPQKVGGRQYPGLMAQCSLVPPFELQHRPDGLPSGLIGADGVRRSLNDPEVCLECMMRDEDMIDITVTGEGVWERESDKEFEEAVRLEAEEAANGNGSFNGPGESSGHGDSINSHRDSRGSRRPRKKIGKGEPLTVDRLKLHTQMNPPASSFRWRTLQTFLAVQAKYIAMEQQRMRLEAEKKARHNDSISSRRSILGAESPLPVERGLSSPFAPPREASAAQRQSIIQTSAEDSSLTPLQKQEKERDVAAAQAACKKMTVGANAAASAVTPPMGLPAFPAAPMQTRTPPQAIPGRSSSDPDDLLVGLPAAAVAAPPGGILTPTSGRRVPFGSAQAARAASVQDLRSAAEQGRSASAGYPPSPSDSLMPPSRSFMGTSPTGTPSRLAARFGASQLSLMHSGSMIDMHVGQEDRAEHRINQNGFLPGTPLGVDSPAAMNRSYYGFPGDGDSSLPDAAAFERSRMVSGEGYVDPMEAGPRGLDLDREDSGKPKKKGFRGLLSKLTGNSNGPSRENSAGRGNSSINGSIASRNASKRSQGSGSPRPRQNSFSADRSLDATSPTMNGMLSKARKSTSSFFRNGAEPDADSKARPQMSNSNSIFQNPPGMVSQNSLDLGPFQPASPQNNTFGSTNGRIVQQQPQQGYAGSDPARMRKASNPLMQKYLNSPSPQTQASPIMHPSSGGVTGDQRIPVHPSQMSPADARSSRISSFASMRELRPSALQTIPDDDGDAPRGDGGVDDPRQSMRSSADSASLRKELPSMPPSAGGARTGDASFGTPIEHQRNGSNGTSGVRSSVVDSVGSARSPGLAPAQQLGRPVPAEYTGRVSMQASRSAGGLGRQPAPPAIQTDFGYGSTLQDNASINSASGPQRPPKNPRRPADGALNSPSIIDLTNGTSSTGLVPPPRDFPQQIQYGASDYNSPESTGQKSRFRLPFGRKKRESTFGPSAGISNDSKPSIVVAEAQPRASSTFLPKLCTRKSYAGGLGVPKQSFTMERQRVLSSPARESTSLPPRSQSAFGMAPAQRFVSMDIPRRSMNVGRGGNNRLSTMGYEEDERDEEEEDDEMEREPGYEAEFERYAQEAEEERYAGGRGVAAAKSTTSSSASSRPGPGFSVNDATYVKRGLFADQIAAARSARLARVPSYNFDDMAKSSSDNAAQPMMKRQPSFEQLRSHGSATSGAPTFRVSRFEVVVQGEPGRSRDAYGHENAMRGDINSHTPSFASASGRSGKTALLAAYKQAFAGDVAGAKSSGSSSGERRHRDRSEKSSKHGDKRREKTVAVRFEAEAENDDAPRSSEREKGSDHLHRSKSAPQIAIQNDTANNGLAAEVTGIKPSHSDLAQSRQAAKREAEWEDDEDERPTTPPERMLHAQTPRTGVKASRVPAQRVVMQSAVKVSAARVAAPTPSAKVAASRVMTDSTSLESSPEPKVRVAPRTPKAQPAKIELTVDAGTEQAEEHAKKDEKEEEAKHEKEIEARKAKEIEEAKAADTKKTTTSMSTVQASKQPAKPAPAKSAPVKAGPSASIAAKARLEGKTAIKPATKPATTAASSSAAVTDSKKVVTKTASTVSRPVVTRKPLTASTAASRAAQKPAVSSTSRIRATKPAATAKSNINATASSAAAARAKLAASTKPATSAAPSTTVSRKKAETTVASVTSRLTAPTASTRNKIVPSAAVKKFQPKASSLSSSSLVSKTRPKSSIAASLTAKSKLVGAQSAASDKAKAVRRASITMAARIEKHRRASAAGASPVPTAVLAASAESAEQIISGAAVEPAADEEVVAEVVAELPSVGATPLGEDTKCEERKEEEVTALALDQKVAVDEFEITEASQVEIPSEDRDAASTTNDESQMSGALEESIDVTDEVSSSNDMVEEEEQEQGASVSADETPAETATPVKTPLKADNVTAARVRTPLSAKDLNLPKVTPNRSATAEKVSSPLLSSHKTRSPFASSPLRRSAAPKASLLAQLQVESSFEESESESDMEDETDEVVQLNFGARPTVSKSPMAKTHQVVAAAKKQLVLGLDSSDASLVEANESDETVLLESAA